MTPKIFGFATVGSKGQIVIPVEGRTTFNIKEGDRMVIASGPTGFGLMVAKAEVVEQFFANIQKDAEAIAANIQKDKLNQ